MAKHVRSAHVPPSRKNNLLRGRSSSSAARASQCEQESACSLFTNETVETGRFVYVYFSAFPTCFLIKLRVNARDTVFFLSTRDSTSEYFINKLTNASYQAQVHMLLHSLLVMDQGWEYVLLTLSFYVWTQ